MWLLKAGRASAALTVVAMLLSAGESRAHEGHDHGAPPPPVSSTIAPRAEASSDSLEIVLIARGGELIIQLDEFRSNAPIAGAELEIDGPDGLLKPIAVGEGSYKVNAPFLTKPGSYDLAITVSARETVEILAVTLTIPSAAGVNTPAHGNRSWLTAPAFAQELKQRVADSGLSLWFAVLMGFVIGALVTYVIGRRRWALSALIALVLSAALLPTGPATADAPSSSSSTRDLAQRFPDGSLFVPKRTQHILGLRTALTEQRTHRRTVELPGRIIPSPNASGLVQASVGGRLSPPEGGFKPLGTVVRAGDILAYVRPPLPLADATAQQQQSRELDQQISIISRKVDRLRTIQQVIAASQLEDAELELKGLRTRRANLERVPLEPEALVAPVDGVLASTNAVAGQMAEPNAVIFRIIDPSVLWIEALSYEADAVVGAAQALFPDGRTVDLDHLGTGLADRNQAVPIHFSIRGTALALRAGQFVTVLASTSEEKLGIALPREAILRGANGQSVVYEHTNAERFVIREVRVLPLDGSHVLIVAGIEAGRRIVTQGAELLNQIR
jgi:cobalt-zinc-cadmium efflux system membrane fusion protein